ncbi:hypothetical protein BJ875DRAFT_227006 [Amylocarpus encephaloides]|uniref:Extracellular membrane protein CFEM domain-containing protein n=1 Tax=Amylocarpus encephaloides TaxID=45428 RepID=A0A9P7Y7A9_9HELO|nr:hypothetical protein BJ875DRAFT_227006 [Amylocarpus encephaloides]
MLEIMAILPECAVRCMTELSSILPGMPVIQICTVQKQSHRLELCTRTTCTIKEAFTTRNIAERYCNQPLRDRTNTVLITAVVGVSLALFAVVLRLLSRFKSRKPGIDDWTIIAAMGFVIPLSAMGVIRKSRIVFKRTPLLQVDDC